MKLPYKDLKNWLSSIGKTACTGGVTGILIAGLVLPPQLALAQSQSGQQQQQKPEVPEAGGPGGDIGPMAVPKKTEAPPPPPPPKPKANPDSPSYSIAVDVPLVNIDVSANTKDGGFIPGLKKENFRILEDGVEQQVTNFSQTEAPITAVLLVEFANGSYAFMYDALMASYNFAANLKKDDWVAITEFDMKPHILTDFTQDKRAIYGALNTLRIPGFSETNVFDALYDTLDRLDRVEGRKEIVLVASGRDTFSKITFDQILKKVKATPNVTIFPISTGQAFLIWAEANRLMGPIRQLDYLQADNEMNTYAKLTGGQWYHPRFEGELPEIFRDIAARVRNQYTLSYHPTNRKQDGSYRKVKVELVAGDGSGKPLIVKNEKGKELKTVLAYREGYTAKHQVE
jgi:VWFA-related protein